MPEVTVPVGGSGEIITTTDTWFSPAGGGIQITTDTSGSKGFREIPEPDGIVIGPGKTVEYRNIRNNPASFTHMDIS
ncbi:MAG: hypothetical protein AAGD43_21450 [Pseudomonadota bacterium]